MARSPAGNLADTEGDLLDRIVTHAGLSGPEQTFLSARLAPPTRQHRCRPRAGPTPVNQMHARAGGHQPENADRDCCVPRAGGVAASSWCETEAGLTIEKSFLDNFARRWGIRRLALYGSVLRDDFGPSGDFDMLVEFLPGRTPGLLRLAQMELELEAAVGREGELRTYGDLSPYFRDDVAVTAHPVYAVRRPQRPVNSSSANSILVGSFTRTLSPSSAATRR